LNCLYAKLNQESLLHLQGPDSLSFLQGQVTCDTRKLAASVALPGALCTVQGRVVGDFLLCALGERHLVLRLRRDVRATMAAVLAKYIIFSKAELEPEREDWLVLGCWGPAAGAAVLDSFGTRPQGKFGASSGEGFALVQTDEAGQQFELYLHADAAPGLLQKLGERMDTGSEADWQALQIAHGIARIEGGTSGEMIPQMLNYDVTGHISFNKGCYTGQEVVARMHYRGKPKRRLYRATIPSGDLLTGQRAAAGDALFSGEGSQAAGNVINAVPDADGRLLLLVTATTQGIETGLHLSAPDGPLLQIDSLPYAVPVK
jgi:folate-binding protein YgfZ